MSSLFGSVRSVVFGYLSECGVVYNEALQAQAYGWNTTVWAFYGGAAEPTSADRATAEDQLARLELPPL